MFGNQDEEFTFVAKEIRKAAQYFGNKIHAQEHEISEDRVLLKNTTITHSKESSSNLSI